MLIDTRLFYDILLGRFNDVEQPIGIEPCVFFRLIEDDNLYQSFIIKRRKRYNEFNI